MWSASHLHGPRRSHDQGHQESRASRSSSPDDGTDSPRRRTSSDATPRQTPATTRFLTSANDQDILRSVLGSTSTLIAERPEAFSSTKRLGYFADKLTSSLSGTAKETGNTLKNTLHPSQLLHPHIHSRAESGSASPNPSSSAPVSANQPTASKSHTSPSKPSYGRTYDPKVVSREMHRLGNSGPQLSAPPSSSSLAIPPSGTPSQTGTSSAHPTEPWDVLHVQVLPLFNGEPLRIPIEDLNVLVKRHIQIAVSQSPSRAISSLENDASGLIAVGMDTLNAKLAGIDDEKLVPRVVEIWGFFWDQVLTYLEGVLLPLQTDPLLLSLHRTPKTHRATSPTRQAGPKPTLSSNSSATSTNRIDVRSVALRSFRDKVILPIKQRLASRLSLSNRQDNFQETQSYQQPRLQQMLLVLSSQSRHLPKTFSLTTPPPQPTPGEAAVKELLRLVRSPASQSEARAAKFKSNTGFPSRALTFSSGGIPRDRRGRVAYKGKNLPELIGIPSPGQDEDLYGDDTPRLAASGEMEREREREKEVEALRSPDFDPRASMGGWGLGAGVENSKPSEDDDEDDEEEALDWDKTQAVVERMVGMNPVRSSSRNF
ncbi:HbrB-domain-containing protein [Agrocybe pediades]|nr:HbrB-domain-containing protein [Agrocybe pediades]